jgi:hypothetical protein
MSPRRHWDSPNPSLASEFAPPLKGWGVHSPAGEGLGEFQFRRLEKSLVALCLFCDFITKCLQNLKLMRKRRKVLQNASYNSTV